ncbi:4-hydroxy-tetrahydrodipicolinate synthase [Pueribacillus theae]|uniref:4-hydroxy-tetrahydrodipicolinate synthase n=1 Tax=Pueribacillus theae TaxID=2171751 RepID=A0A2U1K8P8_9BACI|nr:4-hydroxy-tetrahydrodipicolinate synthase [Pueribacillus theae]PWA13558.1 4-hydroxy-tetrahydrodipicolinate synthase [Pueribacillus theae]
MDFGQLLTAMVTPFNEKDEIDLESTTRLVHFLIENGTDGLVVSGTTGESPTLTTEEKLALIEHVVKEAKGKATVIAGTGSNNTASSIELTKEAEQLGVDGIMLVAPYYNRPDQQGLYEHFKKIAQATSLPVMIYNIPSRSSVNIQAETMIKLSHIDNIVSAKEASGDLDQMSSIIENTSDDFKLYSGDDSLTLPILSIGGCGVVSVASHIIGNEMQEMINAFNKGEMRKAASIHRSILPVIKALFGHPSPTPVKAALALQGIETGPVRLPLVSLTDEQKASLNEVIQNFKQRMIR